MDFRGQVTLEYVFLVGITLIITLMFVSYLEEDNELNIAMSAARSGALEGATMDSFAIYPKNSFKEYEISKTRLTGTSAIKIIKIEMQNQGYDDRYEKVKIQLKVYAKCPTVTEKVDRDSLGDRINYNVRKSISNSFGTESLSNDLYNPAFSEKFFFTTADVKWI
jgi:uncharacterized protein (UPF0333 family)